MKKNKKLIMLASTVLLLAITVAGTIAYLTRTTTEVTNEFQPAKVEISISETFANNGDKTSIVINNCPLDASGNKVTGENNIPVYIRVALVANYALPGGEICVKHEYSQPSFVLGADWVKGSDGFYYYTKPVDADGNTTNLLGTSAEIDMTPSVNDGCTCKYQVNVIASAIQAEGTLDSVETVNAIEDAWTNDKVTISVNADKTLTVTNK